jgi:hypothetical protein
MRLYTARDCSPRWMSGNGSAPVKVMAVYVVEKGKPMVQAGTVTSALLFPREGGKRLYRAHGELKKHAI